MGDTVTIPNPAISVNIKPILKISNQRQWTSYLKEPFSSPPFLQCYLGSYASRYKKKKSDKLPQVNTILKKKHWPQHKYYPFSFFWGLVTIIFCFLKQSVKVIGTILVDANISSAVSPILTGINTVSWWGRSPLSVTGWSSLVFTSRPVRKDLPDTLHSIWTPTAGNKMATSKFLQPLLYPMWTQGLYCSSDDFQIRFLAQKHSIPSLNGWHNSKESATVNAFVYFFCETARGLKQPINEYVDHWPVLSYFYSLLSLQIIDAVYEVFCFYKKLIIQCVKKMLVL